MKYKHKSTDIAFNLSNIFYFHCLTSVFLSSSFFIHILVRWCCFSMLFFFYLDTHFRWCILKWMKTNNKLIPLSFSDILKIYTSIRLGKRLNWCEIFHYLWWQFAFIEAITVSILTIYERQLSTTKANAEAKIKYNYNTI